MLGVFRADLKKLPSPPEIPGDDYDPAMQGCNLEDFFVANLNHPVVVSLGNYGFLAYCADKDISPSPGPLFCMRGGISCIYRGGTKIMRKGKKVEETGDEVDDLIAYYKDLKGNGYQTPFVPLEVPSGDYNYILYDSSPGREFAFSVNWSDDVPVYYGYDSLGFCILADNMLVMMEVCGDTYKTIPKGKGILIPVIEEVKIEPIGVIGVDSLGVTDPKKNAEKATEGNPSGGSSSSVVDASKGESIKAKSSGGSSPKKTSGKAVEGSPSGGSSIIKKSDGEAVAGSPSGGSSSKKGSAEKRSAASSSGGTSSKKGRG